MPCTTMPPTTGPRKWPLLRSILTLVSPGFQLFNYSFWYQKPMVEPL
jgi:hypothetical protein